jgi:mono/diheme cytochrome c family protein
MNSRIFLLWLATGAGLVGIAGHAASAPLTLKSVNVTFPDSDRALPNGPGLEAVQGNCLACHSAGMILTQPVMPKAAWAAEVAKMRNVYKAPVDEKDVPDIVEYLTAVKGPK